MSSDAPDPKLVAAQNYERLVVPFSAAPSAALLLEHAGLRPGERVVDIACGTGIVSRLAAPLVGTSATIVAVDINPAMLAVGRSLPPPAGAAIDWREGNAQSLPLPDASCDVALCNQGLSFFADGVAALREMRRVLSPGGSACIAVWDVYNSPVSLLIWSTMSRRLDTPLTTLARGFSLSEAGKVEAMMDEAGFPVVRGLTRPLILRQPTDDNQIAQLFAGVRGLVPCLAAMSTDEVAALARSVQDEIGGSLRRYEDDGQQIFPMSVHIVVARA